MQKCNTCVYATIDMRGQMRCIRFPPQIVTELKSAFPRCPNRTCGEYKKKD